MMNEWKYFGFQANLEERLTVERNRRRRGIRTVSEYLRTLVREDDQKNFPQYAPIGNKEVPAAHLVNGLESATVHKIMNGKPEEKEE